MNLPPDVAQHPVAYFVAVAFGAIVVGLVCGLIALAAGALTKQKRLAILGFTACFVEHNEPTPPTGGT